jgi:hypothetical protein
MNNLSDGCFMCIYANFGGGGGGGGRRLQSDDDDDGGDGMGMFVACMEFPEPIANSCSAVDTAKFENGLQGVLAPCMLCVLPFIADSDSALPRAIGLCGPTAPAPSSSGDSFAEPAIATHVVAAAVVQGTVFNSSTFKAAMASQNIAVNHSIVEIHAAVKLSGLAGRAAIYSEEQECKECRIKRYMLRTAAAQVVGAKVDDVKIYSVFDNRRRHLQEDDSSGGSVTAVFDFELAGGYNDAERNALAADTFLPALGAAVANINIASVMAATGATEREYNDAKVTDFDLLNVAASNATVATMVKYTVVAAGGTASASIATIKDATASPEFLANALTTVGVQTKPGDVETKASAWNEDTSAEDWLAVTDFLLKPAVNTDPQPGPMPTPMAPVSDPADEETDSTAIIIVVIVVGVCALGLASIIVIKACCNNDSAQQKKTEGPGSLDAGPTNAATKIESGPTNLVPKRTGGVTAVFAASGAPAVMPAAVPMVPPATVAYEPNGSSSVAPAPEGPSLSAVSSALATSASANLKDDNTATVDIPVDVTQKLQEVQGPAPSLFEDTGITAYEYSAANTHYEGGCSHFESQSFPDARKAFDNGILILAPHAHHLDVAASHHLGGHVIHHLKDCVSDNGVVTGHLMAAVKNRGSPHTAAKHYRKLLNAISVADELRQTEAGVAHEDFGARQAILWKQLRDSGLGETAMSHLYGASKTGSDREMTQHLAALVRVLKIKAVGPQYRAQLQQFTTQIEAKCLLHDLVAHKIGNLAYESCKRLDRTVVKTTADVKLRVRLETDNAHGRSELQMYAQRLTLLSIFVTGIPCDPKHRVRYIRYAIKLNMGMENYGIAATFLKLLTKFAKSNLEKLEQELQICEQHGLVDMLPLDEVSDTPLTVVAGRSYTDMLPHMRAAYVLASQVGDRSGESRDCAIVGLVCWCASTGVPT